MELSAVLLARTIALFETALINPRASISPLGIVSKLVERFSFQGVPKTLEDYDASKGIEFKAGYFDGHAIDKLIFYNDGIRVDDRSSTEAGQKLITGTLEFFRDEGLIYYEEKLISRWAFLSEVLVESDVDLDGITSAFTQLSDTLTKLVTQQRGIPFQYRVRGITVDFERLNVDYAIAPFQFERRLKSLDSEKRYYSQAPLETSKHLEVLSQFEENLRIISEGRKGTIRRAPAKDASAKA